MEARNHTTARDATGICINNGAGSDLSTQVEICAQGEHQPLDGAEEDQHTCQVPSRCNSSRVAPAEPRMVTRKARHESEVYTTDIAFMTAG